MGKGDFRDLKVFRVFKDFKDFKVLRDIRLQGREDMPLTLFIYIGEGHGVIFVIHSLPCREGRDGSSYKLWLMVRLRTSNCCSRVNFTKLTA